MSVGAVASTPLSRQHCMEASIDAAFVRGYSDNLHEATNFWWSHIHKLDCIA